MRGVPAQKECQKFSVLYSTSIRNVAFAMFFIKAETNCISHAFFLIVTSKGESKFTLQNQFLMGRTAMSRRNRHQTVVVYNTLLLTTN